jgi:cell division protein FtsQ
MTRGFAKSNHRNRAARGFFAYGDRRRVRVVARTAAVLFLFAAIARGVVLGGYLDYEGSPFARLPGKLAGLAGMAAEDIKIDGLVHQDAEAVLKAIGVAPGASLIGFDAAQAKRLLENLDWVASAKVQRLFPNQLEITVAERHPFAIWQRDGNYYVIDQSGAAMSTLPASLMTKLPLVSGEGAQKTAAELINQLEAFPDIMLQVKAAARVGDRRWNLYLDNGVKVLLPEEGVVEALAKADELDRTQKLLSKGITAIDLRLRDRIVVAMAEIEEPEESKAAVKKSKAR